MTMIIVDGDKGGVGKSFVARAVADYVLLHKNGGRLFVVDTDPTTPDVAGGKGGFSLTSKTFNGVEVSGIYSPVTSVDDWFATIDQIAKLSSSSENDFVVSLPAGAGLNITDTVLDLFSLASPVFTIWVVGRGEGSVNALNARTNRAREFYSKGIVALNNFFGSQDKGTFFEWTGSGLRTQLISGGWREIAVPVLNAFVVKAIGTTPLHEAHQSSAEGNASPTIRIGIEAFRRAFWAQLQPAIEAM